MRRFLLIFFGLLLGSASLLALYVVLDFDPDDTSPTVEVTSWMARFEAAARARAGAEYATLNDPRKLKTLGELIAPGESEAVREVALYKLRELPDKEGVLAVLRRNQTSLTPDQFEVAIATASKLGTPKSKAWLDSLYKALDADPAAHIPLGGYRMTSLLVSVADADLVASFNERSRNAANYSLNTASEITCFFPRNPDYFVTVPNADDVIEHFGESKFVKTLDGSPVPGDVWALPILRTISALRNRLTDEMGFMGSYFSPEVMFRDNLLVGRYGNEYLMAAFKDKNVTVAETMMKIFEALGSDFGVKQWDVGGVTVRSVMNRKTGKSLAYATPEGYFVVATDSGLISQALRTFGTDRTASIGNDPLFSQHYLAVDQSGEREVMFAWLNPTRYFDMIGSDRQSARQLAIVARALGKPVNEPASEAGTLAAMRQIPGMIGSTLASGQTSDKLWKYVVDVRSVGKNPLDSLARLSKINVGKQIIPFLSGTATVGYFGLDYLREQYAYSNTGFNTLIAIPLRTPPAKFDSTLGIFFGRITSLAYRQDPMADGKNRLFLASDTTTNDSLLLARKFQPSFAVIDNRILLIATTPDLLQRAAPVFSRTWSSVAAESEYIVGNIKVDSFAVNSATYLRGHLLRTDRYAPEEITERLDPLKNALTLYDRLEWKFKTEDGLRVGQARLVAKK